MPSKRTRAEGAPTWPILAVLAAVIAVATVLGRYHYAVDAAAGVLVALAAWGLVVALA